MADPRADTRLMTYAELGEAIGRSEVAARAMAMRKRWKRVLGNDGRARVAVSIELVERLKTKADARAEGVRAAAVAVLVALAEARVNDRQIRSAGEGSEPSPRSRPLRSIPGL
jgi:hypothetical protein